MGKTGLSIIEPEKNKITIKVSAQVEKDGKLLLIKEKTPSSEGYKWNVIKGTFNPLGDRTLEDAITREIKEETGISHFHVLKMTNSFVVKKKDETIVQINYHVTTKEDINIDNIRLEDDEDIIELKLFAKDELLKMRENDFLTKRAFILINDWTRKETVNRYLSNKSKLNRRRGKLGGRLSPRIT